MDAIPPEALQVADPPSLIADRAATSDRAGAGAIGQTIGRSARAGPPAGPVRVICTPTC